jgi:hypothetical protein
MAFKKVAISAHKILIFQRLRIRGLGVRVSPGRALLQFFAGFLAKRTLDV